MDDVPPTLRTARWDSWYMRRENLMCLPPFLYKSHYNQINNNLIAQISKNSFYFQDYQFLCLNAVSW